MSAPSPAYRVTVDGIDVSGRVLPRLMSLSLTEKRGGEADELNLTLSDHDDAVPIPRRGAIIALDMGWRGQVLVEKGRFKIDEAGWDSAPGVITVRARSADFTADLRIRRQRSWRETTLAAVLGEVAAGAGLGAHIDAGLGAIAVPVLAQSRESDLALLRRLGHDHDAVATIKAGKLIFAPIGTGRTATGAALPTITLKRGDGDSVKWKTADRGSYKGVVAAWRDPAAAVTKTVVVGETEGARRLKKTYASEADAARSAKAEWNRIQRSAADLSYTLAIGRPEIGPDLLASVSGFKPEIDASKWLTAKVVHNGSESGLTTVIDLETAL